MTVTDKIALFMAEDAYAGDAQFTVSVDGAQIGGIYTATTAYVAGASQEFDITGNFGTGRHVVSINFLNDAYGGAGLDRNLYLTGLSYNGVTQFNQSLQLYSSGTQSVSIRAPVTPGLSLLGVNLSGAEYGSTSTVGSAGTDYVLPTNAELDYYALKGLNVIRLPFQWERMQPTQGGALNATYLAQIDSVVNYANSRGLKVDLDLHGFGNGYGNAVGTSGTPASSLDNLWSRLAAHYAANSNVLFGIMNEPTTQTAQDWANIEQSAVLAIRAAGATTQEILASGVGADSGINWIASGNAAVLASTVVDPNHNLAFEVHQYFNSDSSGTATDITSATDGPERLAGVTDWATSNGVRLFLGEFATATDAKSLTALDNTLSYLQQHNDVWQGGTYWAGGQWWGNYPFSIEPSNGTDAAQMGVLKQYVSPTAPVASSNSGATSLTISGTNTQATLQPLIKTITGNRDGGGTWTGASSANSTVTLTETIVGKPTILGTAVTSSTGSWQIITNVAINRSTVHSYSVSAQGQSGGTGQMAGSLYLDSSNADIITGHTGVSDVFAVMSSKGSEIIKGFETSSATGSAHDYLDLSGRGVSSFTQVRSILSGDISATITLGSGRTIVLTDVAVSSLTAADFRYS